MTIKIVKETYVIIVLRAILYYQIPAITGRVFETTSMSSIPAIVFCINFGNLTHTINAVVNLKTC